MKKIRIPFIYAEDCKHCQMALASLQSAIQKSPKISCNIAKFLYTNEAAIAIAIAQNIDTLPGFVIGNQVFQGDKYDEDEILKAIKQCENLGKL